MNNQQKYVALYERLSHDDEQLGESNSISHQQMFYGEVRHPAVHDRRAGKADATLRRGCG